MASKLNEILSKYKTVTTNKHTNELLDQAKASKPEITKDNEEQYKEELDELFIKNEEIMKKYCTLYSSNNNINALNKPFNDQKQRRKENENSTGKNWYNMKSTTMTPEVEKDLKTIQLRHIIDPTRFYKKPDSNGLPRFFQIGTIHTPLTMGKKYRMKNSEVRGTLAEEFLDNDKSVNYSRRKFNEIQSKKITLGRKKRKMNDFKLKAKNKKKEYIKK